MENINEKCQKIIACLNIIYQSDKNASQAFLKDLFNSDNDKTLKKPISEDDIEELVYWQEKSLLKKITDNS